jgi:hypothetical protein
MLTTSILIGLVVALAAFTVLALFLPLRQPKAPTTHPAPADEHHPVSTTVPWPPGWPHKIPGRPFTVAEAHQAMLTHYTCDRSECPRKDAAWMTLVDAGRILPAGSRGYRR